VVLQISTWPSVALHGRAFLLLCTMVVSRTVDLLQSLDVVARYESHWEVTLSRRTTVKGLAVRPQW
jgi:hypothetical protein